MKKSKYYDRTKFSSKTIMNCIDIVEKDLQMSDLFLSVSFGNEEWEYDHIDQFTNDYNRDCTDAYASISFKNTESVNYEQFALFFNTSRTRISFSSGSREKICKIFNLFDENVEVSLLPEPKIMNIKDDLVVYIGHGRDNDWKIIKEELQDKHKIMVETYETGARAGHTIRDVLEDMSSKSQFAILVCTAEDIQKDDKVRARQNVIHEAGLFQGKLGFNKAIIVMKKNVEMPSNLDGIQQIRYNDNIKETISDILATITREFS